MSFSILWLNTTLFIIYEKMPEEQNIDLDFWDMLPEDHKYYTFLKKVFRHEFRKNWFKRISTPILEKKSVYDNVFWEKISSFSSILFWNNILRNKPCIPILRAYIDWKFEEEIQPVYFYYIDRYFSLLENSEVKEVFLIGWEIIWENDAVLDALLIQMTYNVLCQTWLKDEFVIKINTLWTEKERVKYTDELKSFYENKKHLLSQESINKLDTNPILVLKTNDEDEIILADQSTKITKFLKKDSKAHYLKVKEYLDLLEIPYIEDCKVVSGDEYKTNTIWEFFSEKYWVISEWNRHNSLSLKLWRPKEIPATWFSLDVQLVISILKEKEIKLKNKDEIDLYFVWLWDEAKKLVLPISLEARKSWINTMLSLWTPSLKEQILKWTRLWAKFLVIVWVMEARNGILQVRNMIEWTQSEVKKEDLIEYIIEKIWIKNLDFYSPTKDLVIQD